MEVFHQVKDVIHKRPLYVGNIKTIKWKRLKLGCYTFSNESLTVQNAQN